MFEKTELSKTIKEWFYFNNPNHVEGIRVLKSEQLTREQVEAIAFNASTPEAIALNFQNIIKQADGMMKGESDMTSNGQPYKFPAYRILYILWADGLKIWID